MSHHRRRSSLHTQQPSQRAAQDKWSSLPSLFVDPKKLQSSSLTEIEFAHVAPIFRRHRFDLFGIDDTDVQFRHKSLRTPRATKTEILHEIEEEKKLEEERFITLFRPTLEEDLAALEGKGKTQPLQTQSEGRNRRRTNSSGQGYHIKKQSFGQFLKSENERKNQLDFAVQRKKDLVRTNTLRPIARQSFLSTPQGSQKNAPLPLPLPVSSVEPTEIDIARAVAASTGAAVQRTMTAENYLEATMGLDMPDADPEMLEKFVGPAAMEAFQNKFRHAARMLERYPNVEDLPEELRTPRSMFLRGLEKDKLLPLPLLMRDGGDPLSLNLSRRGLGDLRVKPLIDVLESIPALHSISLADNRLTDTTLMPLALKLPMLQTLTFLDLSFNKIDECAETIMDYLRSEQCKLRTLVLNGADVDDQECVHLASAIAVNKSLRTLSLSKNLIGKAELLNVLHPELTTGGEAIGDMLRENTTLTKLDLSWNSIRLDSAIALAKSLEVNQTLRVLLLGYNSFGDMPSQYLGKALKVNKSLTELDLESNSINPKAATVLANAISFNETLLKLNINGNTLGKIGAQALVAAIQRSSTESRKLQVSFVNCDCTKDDDNIFSAANPHGTWRVNLREPYGQMVAAECLYLANYKAGCRIVKLLHNGNLITLQRSYVASADEGEAGALKKFKLEEFYKNCRMGANELLAENYVEASKYLNNLLTQFGFRMDEENRLSVLRKTRELWVVKAKREGRDDLQEVFLYEIFFGLFVINDVDMSGTMELDEFVETLIALGKPEYDRDTAKRLMSEYDRDESGTIDANEFGTIMLNEFCRTEIPRGELVDASTERPWEIPPSGNCVIQLSYQCDVPTLFDIGADHGIDNIIKSIREAKTDDQREILFQNTTSSPYFFLSFEQAQLLFEEMQGLNRLPLDLMANILPQIVNVDQAIRFVDTNLNDLGKFALRIKMGQLFSAFMGLLTGHYAIDLRDASQRNGGRRLGAISVTEGKECRQAGVISSQKGNYSNFRNEKLGVTPVDVTGRWFASATASQNAKVLHCDYVSTQKPRKGTPPLSELKFDKLISQLRLGEVRRVWNRIQQKETQYFEKQQLQQQQQVAEESEKALVSEESAKNIPKKPARQSSLLDFKANDRIQIPAGSVPLQTEAGFVLDYHDFPELIMEAPFSYTYVRDQYVEFIDTCHHFYDIYPEERMRDVSRVGFSLTERPVTPEDMKRGPAPNRNNVPPIFPIAFRKILELQIQMPGIYLNIAQVTALLEYFPPDEGFLRIQLIMVVFSHITDLENMYQIFDNVLTFNERNEALHRLGIMNLLDPMKPDRIYRLDLRRYDHREWVKILVFLAINEPGDNWEGVEYRWGRYDEPVPGWTLPATWCYEDDGGATGGPRNHGWLRLSYRSYGNGCMPVMAVRKHLRKRTLAGMKRIL